VLWNQSCWRCATAEARINVRVEVAGSQPADLALCFGCLAELYRRLHLHLEMERAA